MSNADTKQKILIVDDEPNILDLFLNELSSFGFECVTASNGLEGLSVYSKAKPNIILLDLRMPEMDGLTMLRELRKTEEGKSVPVIILSTVNDEKSVAAALECGVSDFFEKSNWNITELVERIQSNLHEE